jgi:N-acetylglucosaminyldiphosphoundecaprenol N-acetyl-beta-D-mannosaminyltransferase
VTVESVQAAQTVASPAPPHRWILGPVPIDAVTREQAIDWVEHLVKSGRGGSVFTPNVDHVVLASENARMREVYNKVSLSIVDGMPLVWASRILRESVPEKVSGSDFTPLVLERAAARGWRVFFLGGAPGVAAMARDKLAVTLPALKIVGVEAPRIQMDEPPETRADLTARLQAADPQIVMVALGAPKQELLIDSLRSALPSAVFFAVGASLDFIAGTMERAPAWMSGVGLEWFFRLSQEPGRLWKRYLLRDPKFLLILHGAMRDRGLLGAKRK